MGEAQQLEALAYSNMELDATGTIILIPQEASGLLIGDALVGEELLPTEGPVVCQEPCVEVGSVLQQQASASQCLFQGIAEVAQKKRTTLSPRIVTRAVKMRWLDELLEQKQITCPIAGCDARFSSMGTVERHYLSCPGVNGSGMEKCPYCDEQFLTLSNALQEHIPEEHPTMKALLHSEAPRKRPLGTYRRRRTHSNNEPPSKKAPDPMPNTREFEVRRRTYSRAWDQPLGPTSELFRRPQLGDDDPLQLPRDFVNQQDVTMSSEELVLDENQLAEDEQPSSHESPLSILDTASLPRVPVRQATQRPRGSKTNRRPPRPPAQNSRTVQVIVRSERPNSDLLSNPQLLDALGDLATRTELQERVAVHAAATAGGRYLQTELSQRPVLERSEVDRFFGVVKVDSACQTEDLPLQRPRISPAILKKSAPRIFNVHAQVASQTPQPSASPPPASPPPASPPPTAPPVTPTAVPKCIAVSIVCANSGYSSDEDDFSTPAVCQEAPAVCEEAPAVCEEAPAVCQEAPAVCQESPAVCQESPAVCQESPAVCQESPAVCQESPTDHSLLHHPVSLELPLVSNIPVIESAVEGGCESTNHVEPVEFIQPTLGDFAEVATEETLCSSSNVQVAELDMDQGRIGETETAGNPESSLHIDNSENELMQGLVCGAVKDAVGEAPVTIPVLMYSEGVQAQESSADLIQGDTGATVMADSSAIPNQGGTEEALVQSSIASVVDGDERSSLTLESLNNPDQSYTSEALEQDSLVNSVNSDVKDLGLDSVYNSSQVNTEGCLAQESVASSSMPDINANDEVSVSSNNQSQDNTVQGLEEVSALSPVQSVTNDAVGVGSTDDPNQYTTEEAFVLSSMDDQVVNSTEEGLVSDSTGDPNKPCTQEAIVSESITTPVQDNTVEDLVPESVGDRNQDGVEGMVVQSDVVCSAQNEAESSCMPHCLSSQGHDGPEQSLLHSPLPNLAHSQHIENLLPVACSDASGNAAQNLTQDSLITSIQESNEPMQVDSDINMVEQHPGDSLGCGDDLQPGFSMSSELESIPCTSAEAVCINEVERLPVCVDNGQNQSMDVVDTVTSTVPTADSTVPTQSYEEQQGVSGFTPTSNVNDEKSSEVEEHSTSQSLDQSSIDTTNNVAVGRCLQPTIEIAPCLVAPDTEPIEAPDNSVLFNQPCAKGDLPTGEIHAVLEESARNISEFCDHIDASAQVWVAKMREKLNAETEMEYKSHEDDPHKDNVETTESCLQSGSPLHEHAVTQSEPYTVKVDAGSILSGVYEAAHIPYDTPGRPVDGNSDMERCSSDVPSDVPAEERDISAVTVHVSPSEPEAESSTEGCVPLSTAIAPSQSETSNPAREVEDSSETQEQILQQRICAQSEEININEVPTGDSTQTDAAGPVQGMQCEEQCSLSAGFDGPFQGLRNAPVDVNPEELGPVALQAEDIEEMGGQHTGMDVQSEVSTGFVELNLQSEVSLQSVEADTQVELNVEALQDHCPLNEDTESPETGPQPEINLLPVAEETLPIAESQQFETTHTLNVMPPIKGDQHSRLDVFSEGSRSPLAVSEQPMEIHFPSETVQDPLATNPEAETEVGKRDDCETGAADPEAGELLTADECSTSESLPVLIGGCKEATELVPIGGSEQEEATGKPSDLGELRIDVSQAVEENYSEEKFSTDCEAKSDITGQQNMEVDVADIDNVSNGDSVHQEDGRCALEKTTESSGDGGRSVSPEEGSSQWAEDEEDTRSSGEALLHIVESVADEPSPVGETPDQHQDEEHFLGASGGRPSSRSRSRATSVTKKMSNSRVTPKEEPAKKELPGQETPKGIVRRKPRFQLNLDFPDGTPLTCSACKSIFTEKNLIVDHILHAHYNLARVNDDREMSDAERRSALLQASKVISRFECKNDGCDVSFASYISYYTHLSRCPMAPTSQIKCKSECDEQPEVDDDHESPRKKRRSALKALKSFSKIEGERPPSRGSEAAEVSDDSSALILSDETLSDWSCSSEEEDHVSSLQSWRGRFKAPDVCAEKLPEDVIKSWVKGSCCPNKGCTKEFQTLCGLKYHYPRCNQGSCYECCRCGLATIKSPGAMLRHLRSCYQDRPKEDVMKKKKKGKMSSRKPHELHQYTVEFREKHYAKEMLYKEWRPGKWQQLPSSEAEPYLPVFRESPALRLGDATWKTLKLFEVSHQRAHSTVFVGGAVWAAAWCPVPKGAEQWVAVACCPDPDTEWPLVATDQLPSSRGLLQIWNLGELTGSDCDPKPAFLLAHNWGPILDIAWCPSGCWESAGPGQRLGLLALACSDGNVRIISVPHEMPTSGDFAVYGGVVPSVILESPAGPSLCTRLAWYPAKGHSLFAAGYGNGMVALYDLQTSSPLLRGTMLDNTCMLQPLQVIQAHLAAITGLAWNHCTYEPFLASASLDRSAKLWNMNDPAVPVTLFRRGMLRSLAVCQHWNGLFLSGDETYTNSRVVTLYKENGYFNYVPRSLTSHCYTSWWVSVSDWLNMAAACDVGGHVSAISLPFLTGNLDNTKKHRHGRVPIYQTSMVPVDTSIPVPQDTTSHAVAVKHFGLAFQDSPLNSWTPKHDAKGYTALPNQYHLNSVNTVSWNPNGLCWLLSGGQAGIVRLSWLGQLAGKRSRPS